MQYSRQRVIEFNNSLFLSCGYIHIETTLTILMHVMPQRKETLMTLPKRRLNENTRLRAPN